ncbi:hypothetical protein ACK30Y_02255 [Aeromonas caviae]
MLEKTLMARPPKYCDCVTSFHMALGAAVSAPGIDVKNIKTKDVAEERRQEQYIRLSKMDVSISNAIVFSNGDFVFVFKCDDVFYLGLSIDKFTKEEFNVVEDYILEQECSPHHLEECFFINFVHTLYGVYRVLLQSDTIVSQLGLAERINHEDYKGHDFDELMGIFPTLKIYEVGKNSTIVNKDIWEFCTYLAIYCSSMRTGILDDLHIEKIKLLFELKSIRMENLYLFLTASHYKHAFLEIYRCIEAIYYLPWMHSLKSKLATQINSFELARIVSETIKWREKEKVSISELFSMTSAKVFVDSKLSDLSFIDKLDYEKEENRRAFATTLYTIRNQSVHQQDYEIIETIKLTAADWKTLLTFTINLVSHLYDTYSGDIFVYESLFNYE